MRRVSVLAALVLFAACAQAVTSRSPSGPSPKPFQPPTSWGLFVSDRQAVQGTWQLIRLDAGSLKDAQPVSQGHGYAIASADGSTLVEIDYGSNRSVKVQIIDALTGVERTSFEPPFAAAPALTPDGSRLIVMDNRGHSWRVFDTNNGQVTGKLENDADPCCGPFFFWLDPAGRFVYRVLVPGSGFAAKGPVTPVLVEYDLHAGREIGRLKLDGIKAGIWQSGRTINSEPVTTSQIPGVALSPDGSRLSILHGDGDRLMTIDTAALKIVASRQLTAAGQSTNWFGLLPIAAYAKYDEGVQWTLAYSPDGRRLVAAARQTTVDDAGKFSSRGLGIRLIDPESGILIAQMPDIDAYRFFYGPDGTALYAMAVDTRSASSLDQAHHILMRMDPSTLSVVARREFNGTRAILVLALP